MQDTTTKINLDLGKMLGYRVVAKQAEFEGNADLSSADLGVLGAKVGDKIGLKPGRKPTAAS
ncbi:hypothetical protein [Thalassovita mediterranea]|jgi:hypothetical protein|uniref:Uncharacterized protein n=1 Tax=Thalassovita mediterranea TaxID=340021 RepID=A0A0P1GP08_9RHOB|nr:hypothetical protein [Thalassovita mediterranea]MCG7573340.1 hypothetical protein [Phaeobacter sp. CNT1-3]CUH84265.1 hypothetical protein TM5383_01472 [Thalassovita mediterranea]SIS27514.1 hypothetical protein SAMN05421685_10137 [Thalassovita mediterranea]